MHGAPGTPAPAGLETFLATVGPRLFRVALAMTTDVGLAEDLTQETLERVVKRWARIQDAPTAYARRVLVNLAADRWRQRGRRPERVVREVPEQTIPAADEGVVVRQQLLNALRDLPLGQRSVLVLRFLEDMSERETADVLGVGVGTVKSQTARGLARLRQAGLLGPPEGEA